MSDWPFRSERRRVWAPPERYRGFLAVAVPDGVKEIVRSVRNPPAPEGVAEYELLLARKVEWLYQEAGQPRREVERVMWQAGDVWSVPKRGSVGLSLVWGSAVIRTMLCQVGLSQALPAAPAEDPEIVELLQDTCLDEWLQNVADWAGPYESLT